MLLIKNLSSIFLLFSLVSILCSSSCKKKNKCQKRSYSFEHPVSVFPVKETYSIGDTLWFEMNFSDEMKDLYSDEIIKLEDFDFMMNFINFSKFNASVDLNDELAAWSFFEPIYDNIDTIISRPLGPRYKLKYYDYSYHLKFGLIMKEIGIYTFNCNFQNYYPASAGDLNKINVTGSCEAEYLTSIEFPVNRDNSGNFNNNFYLLKNFANPETQTHFENFKNQFFVFEVK
jgi:hypothetical protein